MDESHMCVNKIVEGSEDYNQTREELTTGGSCSIEHTEVRYSRGGLPVSVLWAKISGAECISLEDHHQKYIQYERTLREIVSGS